MTPKDACTAFNLIQEKEIKIAGFTLTELPGARPHFSTPAVLLSDDFSDDRRSKQLIPVTFYLHPYKFHRYFDA